MKQFTLLNSILAVTSLESQDGKGAYLNEAQLQAFEDAISGKDNRITELTQHETNYNNAVDKLNALHPDVASAKDLAEKVNVLSRKLAEKPGVPASGQSENPQNQNDGVDWDKMKFPPKRTGTKIGIPTEIIASDSYFKATISFPT